MNDNTINYQYPIYEVSVQDEELGLTCISFVDKPAIRQDFIFFNEAKQKIYFDDDKRIVVSPILIPDQLILRFDEYGNPFYLKWSADTIENAAWKFIASQNWNNVSIGHNGENISNVDLLQMWIVDNDFDQANVEYGYQLPIGTLMVRYHVLNDELWQLIKKGEVRGLSIEALVNLLPSK